MKKEATYKQLDDALLSFSVLKRLKVGEMDTFEQRLRGQKVHYFAQNFGIVTPYPYNLYLHGPYSPELAADLYCLSKKNVSPDLDSFVSEDLEMRFKATKMFVRDKSNRQLEILATFHWFLKHLGCRVEVAIKRLVDLKGVSRNELNYIYKKIKELPDSL